jgi:hypothetical protein
MPYMFLAFFGVLLLSISFDWDTDTPDDNHSM